jgi:hypothetical protein
VFLASLSVLMIRIRSNRPQTLAFLFLKENGSEIIFATTDPSLETIFVTNIIMSMHIYLLLRLVPLIAQRAGR